MRLELALIAAMLAAPAIAAEGEVRQPDRQQASERSDDPSTASTGTDKGSDDIKGYGYGTQPGQEANAGARQSSRQPKRSKAPQDEQGAASTRAAKREGSAVGARASDTDRATGSKHQKTKHAKKSATQRRATGGAESPAAEPHDRSTTGTHGSAAGTSTSSGAAAGPTSGSETTGDAKR